MKEKSYEEAIKRLEEIVGLLEKNEVPLEESIALFQEGIELSQYCNHKLENIQYKVAKIYENGQLKDFLSEE
ncbi:MAG: exodeoxyribonuclease VII small subunit [Bacilli bacterium]|nr:exodeoxyribonuclease VII small subunit [Bacilli bacterium]